jgi:hypothetical protein
MWKAKSVTLPHFLSSVLILLEERKIVTKVTSEDQELLEEVCQV